MLTARTQLSKPTHRQHFIEEDGQPPTWAKAVRPWNPLHDDAQAAASSCYLAPSASGLRAGLDSGRACPEDAGAIHDRLSSKLLSPEFACVAARSVLNRKTYRLGIYDTLGARDAAMGLCHDLYEFTQEFASGEHPFTSFIAVFRGPQVLSELQFENLLWRQLQLMHALDARYFDWDQNVSKDPANPNFSFSIGGRAFYVIGLNPCASRMARTTHGEACLVFNGHDQFEALRASGKYGQLQKSIRERDIACQGSMNPMMDDFGNTSEARQYSGRAVGADWRCPFQHGAPVATQPA